MEGLQALGTYDCSGGEAGRWAALGGLGKGSLLWLVRGLVCEHKLHREEREGNAEGFPCEFPLCCILPRDVRTLTFCQLMGFPLPR